MSGGPHDRDRLGGAWGMFRVSPEERAQLVTLHGEDADRAADALQQARIMRAYCESAERFFLDPEWAKVARDQHARMDALARMWAAADGCALKAQDERRAILEAVVHVAHDFEQSARWRDDRLDQQFCDVAIDIVARHFPELAELIMREHRRELLAAIEAWPDVGGGRGNVGARVPALMTLLGPLGLACSRKTLEPELARLEGTRRKSPNAK